MISCLPINEMYTFLGSTWHRLALVFILYLSHRRKPLTGARSQRLLQADLGGRWHTNQCINKCVSLVAPEIKRTTAYATKAYCREIEAWATGMYFRLDVKRLAETNSVSEPYSWHCTRHSKWRWSDSSSFNSADPSVFC